jgi:hypothetical protein
VHTHVLYVTGVTHSITLGEVAQRTDIIDLRCGRTGG